MPTGSRIAELLNDRLQDHNTTLTDYIRDARNQGRSWHRLTLDLTRLTGVDVNPETIRLWMRDNPTIT